MGLTIGELKQKQVELTKRLNLFTRQGNYLMMMKTKAEITEVNDAIVEYERAQNIGLDDIQNKHLKSWFGKSISLSINCNDLSIYYLDSTINFLKTKGLVPKGSFETAANNYKQAANNLRKNHPNCHPHNLLKTLRSLCVSCLQLCGIRLQPFQNYL